VQVELLVPKWDLFINMLGKRKNEKKVKVMDLKCVHAKNETAYVSMNHPYVLQHI
jgi:hypothetical protein